MRAEHEGRLFIGGEFREAKSGNRFGVINPADESVIPDGRGESPPG